MKSYEDILVHINGEIEEISLGTHQAEDINPDSHILNDLGLDSLDYASVLLACEKWLNIKVQEDGVDWSRIATIADLAAFLDNQQNR
jgi:acyl carrier protein